MSSGLDRGVRMTCAHDPWDDVCEECSACLGCDPHRDYCPTTAHQSLAPTEKSCIIGGCGHCDDCKNLDGAA